MACPRLDVRRAVLSRRGAKLGGKPKGCPFHPGGHRRGEDRTGELREPSYGEGSGLAAPRSTRPPSHPGTGSGAAAKRRCQPSTRPTATTTGKRKRCGRFEDGHIIERWGSSDELGILKQLGAEPKAD